jgi:hypothetical protein
MPVHGVTDIDTLSLSVRDRESRRLILEAITAYRGGALRSAIISTWIAVAYDIISKARELASLGEANARTFTEQLDRALADRDVRKLQSIESSLLNTANDELQLFAHHEHEAIRRLQEDRNLCAHPAFVVEDALFQPPLELVRAHIVHALQYLLVHAPLQGKSAINRFELDILGPSFPVVREDIGLFLREKYLNRAKDALVIHLIKGIITAPFGGERGKFSGKERQLSRSLGEIATAKTRIYEEVMPAFIAQKFDTVPDDVLLSLCMYIDADRRIWGWLSDPVRVRLRRLLESADVEKLKTFSVFDTFAVPELAAILREKIDGFDAPTQISIISAHPRLEFVPLAIELYGRAGGFRSAETLGDDLIVRLAHHFSALNIEALLVKVKDNGQIHSASGTTDVLNSVFETTRSLLPSTAAAWLAFVNEMTALRGGDATLYYSYPALRAKLDAAG